MYHVDTAVLSAGLLQELAQTVAKLWLEAVHTLEQKQDQDESQLDWADVKTEHCCAQEGSWPLPWLMSCAEAVEARRTREKAERFFIVWMCVMGIGGSLRYWV